MTLRANLNVPRNLRLALVLSAGLAVGLSTPGCADDPKAGGLCALDSAVVPGCGLLVGSKEARIGDLLGDLALGTPDRVMDFGEAGQRLAYDDAAVSIYIDAGGVVTQLVAESGFSGKTQGGLAIGSARAKAESEVGPLASEPVMGLGRGEGVLVEFEDDVVARIHIVR
jgi:hypothetical protein